LAGAANEMIASLQMARSEAIRLNSRTRVCRSTDNATCANGATWTSWITLGDTDGDGAVDDVLRISRVKTPVALVSSSNIDNSVVEFRPDGLARRTSNGALLAANFRFCIPTRKPVLNGRYVNIGSGSRFTVSSVDANATCGLAVPN
jgi:type IV fimbrial biogenesis protein FimT